MDLFELTAKLSLDSSEFTKGLEGANSQGSSLSQKLSKVVSVAKKVAGALVLKKGIEGLKSLADATAAAGDKIDKQSQALGISRKAYQEWDYILGQNGASIDSLGTSMKTLNTQVLNNSKSFKKLGLTAKDLTKLSLEDQFSAVVEAFTQMPEGAEKSALAVELFGKNGMSLLPLLNSSSQSVEELRKRFYALGLEMSDDAIDAAVRYGDNMDDLKRVFTGIKYAVGAELLPALAGLADEGAQYAGKLLRAYKDGGLSGLFSTLKTDFETFVQSLKDNDSPVLQLIGESLSAIETVILTVVGLMTDFPGTVQTLKDSDSPVLQLAGNALEIFKSALEWIRDNQNAVVTAVSAIVAAFAVTKIATFVANLNPVTLILGAIAGAATLIVTNWETVKTTLITIWGNIKTAVNDAWTSVSKWFGDIKTKISNAWGDIKSWFGENVTGPISTFFNVAYNAAAQLWSDILTAVTNAWSAVSGWVKTNVTEPLTSLFDGVKSIIDGVWSTLQSIFGLGDKDINVRVHYVNEGGHEAWGEVDESGGGGVETGFAKGSWNIPYDMTARLHRNEMVLTSSQARRYREGRNTSNFSDMIPSLVEAIKTGLQDVSVRSYLSSRDVTDDVSRNTLRQLRARRFAT